MGEAVRLLALRPERLERVACLAVDAEESVLACFESWLRAQKESWERRGKRGLGPWVRYVCVGREYEEGGGDAIRGASGAGGKRLKEHWWFDGDGRPFQGTRVCGRRGPAWASPTEAYGATWRALPLIDRAVADLREELLRRNADGLDPLRNLRAYVVGGLAGTTGRGSWNLVAEKVRESLQRFGVRVMPTAVLFGADVYGTVTRCAGWKFQRDAQVNALTGISELSGWVENRRRGGDGCVAWRLPNMLRPDEEGRTDVLQSDESEDPCGGPVGRVHLVCGRNATGCLESPLAYHRMAGKALYAMIEAPEYDATHVNDSECYGSLAGVTFEVDAVHIHAFCETLAQEHVMDQLLEMQKGDAEAVAEAIGEVWAKCPLDAPRNVAEFQPDPRGTLWQRVAHAAMGTQEWQREFENTRNALRNCTVEQAEKLVLPMKQPRWVVPLLGAMEETLRTIDVQAAVEETAKRMIGGDDGAGPSPMRGVEFLKRLRERIAAERATAPERLEMDITGGGQAALDEAMRDWLHECGKRTIGEMLLLRGPYGQDDLDRLCRSENGANGRTWQGIIPQGVLAALYPVVRERIDTELTGVLERIGKRLAGCEAFVDTCRTARMKLASKEGESAGGHSGDNGFELLFATPDQIGETLYTAENPRWLYHRVLKPIVKSRGEVEELAAREVVVGERFIDRIARALDFAAGGEEAAEGSLARVLTDAARAEVHLRPEFLEDHYTFLQVLENNLPYWNRAIAEAEGDSLRWNQLFEGFRVTLGVEPQYDKCSRECKLPSVDRLRWTIAASLALGCRPWWWADTCGTERPGLMFVPFKLCLDSVAGPESDQFWAREMDSCRWMLIGLETGRGSPFAYVAQTEDVLVLTDAEESEGLHPLDKVRSLDGWRDPEVLKSLRLAERKDGAAIFGQEGCTPGVGYVSPLYVRNERLSGCRWKPWMEGRGEE